MENNLKKNLIIFDFDDTLINGCSVMTMLDIVPGLNLRMQAHNVAVVREKGWGEAMSFALQQLHIHGLSKVEIDECLLFLDFFVGQSFFHKLCQSSSNDVIILSHSNEHFIEVLLKKVGATCAINEVLTYPASWTTNGRLEVKRFHDDVIQCQYCPGDFCKGYVLSNHLDKMKAENGCHYEKMIFVGDGRADFCAALCLKEKDLVICRKDYSLHRLISKSKEGGGTAEEGGKFLADHVCWENGEDMANSLLSAISLD
eukprot:gene3714-4234_t